MLLQVPASTSGSMGDSAGVPHGLPALVCSSPPPSGEGLNNGLLVG